MTADPFAPKRFRVTFSNLAGEHFAYDVCTCLNRDKALAMAAGHHERTREAVRDQIYSIVEIVELPGGQPHNSDLVDRAEW